MEDDFDDVGLADDDLTGDGELPDLDGGDETDIDLDAEGALEPAGRPSGGARARTSSSLREADTGAAPATPAAVKAPAKKPTAKAKAKAAKPKARVKTKKAKGSAKKKKAAPKKKAARGKGAARKTARKGARKRRR